MGLAQDGRDIDRDVEDGGQVGGGLVAALVGDVQGGGVAELFQGEIVGGHQKALLSRDSA
ncbi:hypothetical protein D3C77_698120 [compost metagenome]